MPYPRGGNLSCLILRLYFNLAFMSYEDKRRLVEKRFSFRQNMYQFVPYDVHIPKLEDVEAIWSCESLQELAFLMQCQQGPNDRGALGFERFRPYLEGDGNLQTFEFRHLAGTLNSTRICSWVHFCFHFTSICRYSDSQPYRTTPQNMVQFPRTHEYYTAHHLCRDLYTCGFPAYMLLRPAPDFFEGYDARNVAHQHPQIMREAAYEFLNGTLFVGRVFVPRNLAYYPRGEVWAA
ncbi:hypothetical protein F5Y16DRAFT_228227 [Xylariaceae sp. FL0255]|nr:hypothetical protein F5Y16DRAFT_228227 [Xylariaceae sp. FL0255]